MSLFLPLALAALAFAPAGAQWGGEPRTCLPGEPRTLNPILADDDASETVRYLTGGRLVCVSRVHQKLEPESAQSWRIGSAGRTIAFQPRPGLSSRPRGKEPTGVGALLILPRLSRRGQPQFGSFMVPEIEDGSRVEIRSSEGGLSKVRNWSPDVLKLPDFPPICMD